MEQGLTDVIFILSIQVENDNINLFIYFFYSLYKITPQQCTLKAVPPLYGAEVDGNGANPIPRACLHAE